MIDPFADCKQPSHAFLFDSCYLFEPLTARNFSEAIKFCRKNGGQVVYLNLYIILCNFSEFQVAWFDSIENLKAVQREAERRDYFKFGIRW